MSKAKGGKRGTGTGKGTGKKGWNRWQAGANRARNAPKPYTSKGTKNQDRTETASSDKGDKSDT